MLNHGLIPLHYARNRPQRSLRGYVLDYIEQEIHGEVLTRNVPTFARFLEAAAATHGHLINYCNIARFKVSAGDRSPVVDYWGRDNGGEQAL